MKKVTIAEKYVLHAPMNGNADFNQTAFNYGSNLLNWGCSRKRVGGNIVVELGNEIPYDLNDFLYTVQVLLGKVEGYRAIIKLPILQLDDLTPDYLPNRTTVNWDNSDEENPVRLPDTFKTWREWIGKSFTITEIEEYSYFCTQASGIDLSNDELISLVMDGIEIVDSIPVVEDVII